MWWYKGQVYEELEHAFNQFHNNHMKILSRDFNANMGRDDIFKQKTGTESLYKTSNDSGG
jgi:hypothetical protein